MWDLSVFQELDEVRGEETFSDTAFAVQDYVDLVRHGSLIFEALRGLSGQRCSLVGWSVMRSRAPFSFRLFGP
jgi:hypothetical protein